MWISDVWGLHSESNIELGVGYILFTNTFYHSNNAYGRSVEQTTDGGFIAVGDILSNENDHYDFWLIKTDPYGNEEWNHTFGGSVQEYVQFAKQTIDDGFVIVGSTSSIGNGSTDVWLIKTDSQGNEEWNQTYGGNDHDYCYSIKITEDSGYIIAGLTRSFGNGSDDSEKSSV